MAGGNSLPSKEKTVDWCLVNDTPSLLYMVNRSCIETHAWFSRVPQLDEPDVAIFDLDPSGNTGYREAVEAALLIKAALDVYGLTAFPKISGKTGVHVVVPIEPTPYERVRKFLTSVCKALEKTQPNKFTIERTIAKRGDKVYLDAVQNARGKTLPSPYSVRATSRANVSAPVTWKELQSGVTPDEFHIRNMEQRIKEVGDLLPPYIRSGNVCPSFNGCLLRCRFALAGFLFLGRLLRFVSRFGGLDALPEPLHQVDDIARGRFHGFRLYKLTTFHL